ncbi:CcoQ/FixQ family Cbb3-type cytochrome c oxidase assembly chaperone [Aggregicoccus sp. 17bor-14]|uniref:CcoQ/FixQ family Cbb3-type cytochrome c oxidase assembly chaperone n=1 Tax=Myxococcaceae TaxID=31 RepID=UPI00129C15E7|nr:MULTISPECIES: CcoQ/FixQ family Cbb3-type cytochrome c oxidase assembly chaperone [Myxococcaceae]MBF5045693.1 CcoQ/FixQ family Cbb3-type cytochrome c oxidase assembly chaperone [Simulacricoccus sp. 17bor-14]MRI91430.1 CcoQ/FixQ family Cbb3-type cytochrome c oxidase assembly chaperone [Aggregicoccus sp. 17bor-14]
MWKTFYAGMEHVHLPLFSLLLFLAVFFGVVAWVYGLRRPSDFDALAALPLSDTPPSSGASSHEQ